MNIQALIFDFDGLLVDTETPQLTAWQNIYRAHGARLLLEEWVKCLGTSADAFDPIRDLHSKTPLPIDGERLRAEFKARSIEAIQKENLRPGIETLLEQARQRNLRMAVASSSNRTWVESGLNRLHAADYFDVICTSNDVTRVKPDPELFLLALDRLGIDSNEAIVFEDSPMGIQAAKSANLACVAYPNAISVHLDLRQADLVIPSLVDYPLVKILQVFDGYRPDLSHSSD
ncbi:haloacid dehalogenase superfamily, subfamily IA, variant 3 with third motif having DD or ED [Longilinea arvoryzae]|uniref:Haloacid dehalogenase superfamily, subfamily IA, variant 3 with third motif having DD or ED n=1 Tax=Longilinea arvoryzae TaxID=360412 RepID=A0A0S7BGY0_9CHLR|nr:HAD family hydrolase [Longilinea arvoryzae]GAP14861.1 haloacid dehalogenase superfamily, subfamily IA, variant 3 with third motif having DD or ED [Longilinea arvoryzae]